jgi:hypothetical protein
LSTCSRPTDESRPGNFIAILESLSAQNSVISFSTIVLLIWGVVSTILGGLYVLAMLLTYPLLDEGIRAVGDVFLRVFNAVGDAFVRVFNAVGDVFVRVFNAVVDVFVKGLNFLPEWARPLTLSVLAASCFDRTFPVAVTFVIGRSVYDGSIETASILKYVAVSLRDVGTTHCPFMTRENISRLFGISMIVAYSPKLSAASMNLIQLAIAGTVGNSIRTPGFNDPNILNTAPQAHTNIPAK